MYKPKQRIAVLIFATLSIIMGLAAIVSWLLDITALKTTAVGSNLGTFYFALCDIAIGTILIYRQIAAYKGQSHKYLQSEEKYRSLIEQASDIIYILDVDGNFTDVNASMCKITGYTPEELMNLNIRAIVDPEEQKTDPLPEDVARKDESVIRERRFRRKDGKTFLVEVNVKRFSDDMIMVIARDITDRQKMEAKFVDAELKFRIIAEKSIVGVYIVHNGKFSYVNPRFAEILGYSPEEMTNTINIDAIFHDDFKKIANENLRKRITGEVESIRYEARCIKKDGTYNWIEYYGSRSIIDGEPTVMGSMIDVTERKEAEEELRSSERQYKLLFDSNPMPMWMIAKDDQTIIAVNDAGVNHYGYTKEEVLNKNTQLLRPEEDYPEQQETYRKDAQDLDKLRVVRHLKKDGTVIQVQVVSNDITFEGRKVRLSMTNDITEKLIAEQNLKSAYEKIQNHINSIRDMAWKQPHLIRSPLANLQGLLSLLKENQMDAELFTHMQNELNRMDAIIIEMAEEASSHD